MILINAGVALVGVPLKSCSKNMKQTYKRTPMPKCDVCVCVCLCVCVNVYLDFEKNKGERR